MPHRVNRFRSFVPFICFFLAFGLGRAPSASDEAMTSLRHALSLACELRPGNASTIRNHFAGSRLLEVRIVNFRGRPSRAAYRVLLANGAEMAIRRVFPQGRLRRLTVDYWEPASKGIETRPVLSMRAAGDCEPVEFRRLRYDAAGEVSHLTVFASDGVTETQTEPLNPPIPGGRDPGGVLIAVIDTGVNYTLPFLKSRLARDAAGAIKGFDFWDGDARPFDSDTSRSPFFPIRHGTAVTSIIAREAPDARFAVYRFPRPEMSRFEALVEQADKDGAIVVNMAMGSDNRADWRAFERAAASRPHMLFIVSAGNNGRDIDQTPVYPAALTLENILTVTSSDAFGKLAQGSNFGREAVDVMTPGERVRVIDHRGVESQASGSSFAAPRISALAARLLARRPEWKGSDLRDAILRRARKGFGPPPPVKHGWIPDPLDDFEG